MALVDFLWIQWYGDLLDRKDEIIGKVEGPGTNQKEIESTAAFNQSCTLSASRLGELVLLSI